MIARPNDKSIELNHYNSQVFGDSENTEALKIMNNVIVYVEGCLIGPNSEQKYNITDPKVILGNLKEFLDKRKN